MRSMARLGQNGETGSMRIEIMRVEPVFDGLPFGEAGPYEKVVGRAYGDVDPAHPLNRIIANIDKAPLNAAGRVDYSTDFYLLKPVDLARGNRRIFYDVPNRGGKLALHTINEALRDPEGKMRTACNDPGSTADAGNGFLMRQGYTILWSGWQGDLASTDGVMAGQFPIATDGDRPIVGTNRDEFIFEHQQSPVIVRLSYPAHSADQASATLTVRQQEQDERRPIPATDWRFISPNEIEITRPAGYDASAIHEFIYQARDPVVMGLALAATRDLVAFLRHEDADAAGTLNPLAMGKSPHVEHVLAYGISQAGRFLRDFLYQGFNEDWTGSRVFDGVLTCMTGSRKAFVNYPFAQPGRHSRQHEDRLFPHDQFPFTYATTTDPVSGRTDGILARCEASDTCPRIIHTESSSDFFQGRSSLLVTDGAGRDVPIPANVRFFHLASTQHGGGGDPSLDYARAFPASRYAPNPANVAAVHRALVVALDQWVSAGIEPPASDFPSLRDGTLVAAAADRYGFPAIPGVAYPARINELAELDHGVQPPKPISGRDYVVMVPAVDADGNERTGVRLPDVAVPRGTHTGWSARRPGHAEGGLTLLGSYFPFAATAGERQETGDPRPSLEERYPTGDDYLAKVSAAAEALNGRRLLLDEDVARTMGEAGRRIAR